MVKISKEELEKLILVDKLSYKKIGELLSCSDSYVRKLAKKMNIELPKRRKINESESFNKGKKLKPRHCINCGNELLSTQRKYCCNECQSSYERKEYIKRWKAGEESGMKGRTGISKYIRDYLLEKYNNKCQICGWSGFNKYSYTYPLHVHHIDGDATNNKEGNLQLLCPNCHSLTENYGNLNDNCTRK